MHYNMITILIIFSQLAFSYVHSAPLELGGSSQTSSPRIEAWPLKEVWIRQELPGQSLEHYTRRVRLVRSNNAFCLDELRPDTEEAQENRKVFACFKAADFYAYLDDTLYVILHNPHRVIRMALVEKSEALALESYFQPTTFEKTFSVIRTYEIDVLVESTGLTRLRRAETADDGKKAASLTLTVLAEMDRLGSGAGKRRFVMSGGEPRQLFAVFNEGDYNFARFKLGQINTKRFEFVVKPPGDFWGKMHYYFITSSYFDTANRLAEEMRRWASEDIIVRDVSYQMTLSV